MRNKRESGQILPLVGLTLASLMGFGGVAVDVGYWEYSQQAQQNATDAAAIGGAQQLVKSNCTGGSGAKSAAVADAASNGFINAGNVAVTANSPPQSGPYAGNSCAISVSIQAQHVPSFFSRLFGQGERPDDLDAGRRDRRGAQHRRVHLPAQRDGVRRTSTAPTFRAPAARSTSTTRRTSTARP